MNNRQLSLYLARGLFEVGDMPPAKAQRIEFKGGRYPDRETTLGGLGESSLAACLEHLLDRSTLGKHEVTK